MRLKDADDLLKKACAVCGYGDGEWACSRLCGLAKVVDSIPTIEAEPVRHGEWIEYRTYDADTEPGYESYTAKYRCSECGRYELEMEPYCNCGAKMDGGKDANMREEDTNERG